MVLKDGCGRPLLNLRIAITRKCNLNCSYCHREGEEELGNDGNEEITKEEIALIVKTAIGLEISRIKLTGGEPLMRKDAAEIVKTINYMPGLTDLSMTTNGTLLASSAERLRANGLDRVNISLPTLDDEAYHELTSGRVEDALRGVKAAVQAGLYPVKINMLVLRDINDSAVPEMIEFAKEMGAILQLIELEPINMSYEYYSAHHKPMDEYETVLKEKATRVETRQHMQNRRIYHLPDVKVEVIHPTENSDFCLNCTRMRLTTNGKLKPCLMRNDNTVDVLTPIRDGASEKELTELFKQANQNRQVYN